MGHIFWHSFAHEFESACPVFLEGRCSGSVKSLCANTLLIHVTQTLERFFYQFSLFIPLVTGPRHSFELTNRCIEARFKRRISHVPKQVQVSENNRFSSFVRTQRASRSRDKKCYGQQQPLKALHSTFI